MFSPWQSWFVICLAMDTSDIDLSDNHLIQPGVTSMPALASNPYLWWTKIRKCTVDPFCPRRCLRIIQKFPAKTSHLHCLQTSRLIYGLTVFTVEGLLCEGIVTILLSLHNRILYGLVYCMVCAGLYTEPLQCTILSGLCWLHLLDCLFLGGVSVM